GQQDFSMRVWLDPDKLSSMNLTAYDVTAALREQNRQVAAGHIGGVGMSPQDSLRSSEGLTPLHSQSTPLSTAHDFPVTTVGRLTEAEDFEDIVVYTDGTGRKVRIKDVGNVKLGARNLDSTSKVDKLPNASLAVWALPDANSIATAQRVRQRMDELK